MRSINVKTILLIFLLAFIMLIASCSIRSWMEKNEVQKGMEEYLYNKYDKEFVVEELKSSGNEAFGYSYKTTAYPKDQPEIKFNIAWHHGNPEDNYLGILWSYQGTQKYEPYIKEIYDEDAYLSVRFQHNDVKHKDLDFTEVLEKTEGDLACFFSYTVFVDDEIDKRKEAEKVHKVRKKLIFDNRIQMHSLVVNYVSRKHKEEYLRKFGPNKIESVRFDMDELHNQKILINSLRINTVEEVYSVGQLMKEYIF